MIEFMFEVLSVFLLVLVMVMLAVVVVLVMCMLNDCTDGKVAKVWSGIKSWWRRKKKED